MADLQVYFAAAALGAVAGLRSMTAPAIVSHFAQSGRLPVQYPGIEFLNRPTVAHTLAGLAVGEIIADKLPFMPSRTKPGSAIARALSGALCGAAVCSAKNRSLLAGALFGGFGAIGATFGAYELRRRAGEHFEAPDPVIALIEDTIAMGSGVSVVAKLNGAV